MHSLAATYHQLRCAAAPHGQLLSLTVIYLSRSNVFHVLVYKYVSIITPSNVGTVNLQQDGVYDDKRARASAPISI